MIGEEIRKERKAADLSQEELGFKAGLTRNYISMVELNQNSPTLDTLFQISRALGVKVSTLVGRVEREMARNRSSPRRE